MSWYTLLKPYTVMVENYSIFRPIKDTCPKFTPKTTRGLRKAVPLEGCDRASFSDALASIGKSPSSSHHGNLPARGKYLPSTVSPSLRIIRQRPSSTRYCKVDPILKICCQQKKLTINLDYISNEAKIKIGKEKTIIIQRQKSRISGGTGSKLRRRIAKRKIIKCM